MLFAIAEMKSEYDRAYLDTLYRQYYPMLYNLVVSILHDRTDAGDIVTNAMLSLFSKVSFLRSLEKQELVGYLRATVRNAAYKHYNAQKRKKVTEFFSIDSLLFSLPAPSEDPAVLMLKNEAFRQVHDALAALDKRDRQLLHLKYAARLTAREIAQMTNAPNEATVKMRLSRARRKVLRYLEDRGWDYD